MNRKSDMTRILKRISMITGFAILAISIQFSYDGFDQSVNGVNDGYSTMAIFIGYTLAIVFSVIEFIFGTSYRELNWTLRGIGVFAYVYSVYTNYLGVRHILGTSDFIAWSLAFVMDVYPEPAIAWALGEALTGDLFGNLGKMIFGASDKPEPEPKPETPKFNPAVQKFVERNQPKSFNNQNNQGEPKYKPQHKPVFIQPKKIDLQNLGDEDDREFKPFHYGNS